MLHYPVCVSLILLQFAEDKQPVVEFCSLCSVP